MTVEVRKQEVGPSSAQLDGILAPLWSHPQQDRNATDPGRARSNRLCDMMDWTIR